MRSVHSHTCRRSGYLRASTSSARRALPLRPGIAMSRGPSLRSSNAPTAASTLKPETAAEHEDDRPGLRQLQFLPRFAPATSAA